ncbi:MAG TPA: tryptophan-rich sensory protein [bacterium]|nr:tryptophan-rich sensory protein [bacterium]
MKKDLILSVINLFALIGVLAVNTLANSLPINGRSTGEISDGVDFLFKPAGYVFSIWGVIYLALVLFVIAQFFPAIRQTQIVSRIGPWFVFSCLANAGWLFLWHYERLGWSVAVMGILFLSLVMIYLKMAQVQSVHPVYRWCVKAPFSLYLGWISVAVIANISIALKKSGWSAWGISDAGWLVIMLIAGLILSFLMVYLRRDLVFAMVIAWAFIGIGVQHEGRIPLSLIAWAAGILVVLLPLAATGIRGFGNR